MLRRSESETMVIKESPEVNSQIMTIYASHDPAQQQREVNLGICSTKKDQ